MAPDLGELYAASRNRISDLVLSSPPGAGANPCPATPGWTVHDVVAHLRGVTEDVRTGNLDGVATPIRGPPRRSSATAPTAWSNW